MIRNGKSRPIGFTLVFFLICFALRGIEYLVIRTDQTVVGEAFLHKLAGIGLMAAAVWALKYTWRDIGFRPELALKGTLYGVLLGGGAFAAAYGAELAIQSAAGNAPALQFYVTSYAIQGNRGMQDGLWFILLCVAGNLINVLMEEGVFRGLFPRLIEEKHSFLPACLVSSLLFGLWHIAQPLRNALDGEQSAMSAVMSGILLVTTSTLLAIQFCMLMKITGSIWAGMAAHFINNTSVNLLHVATASGADELQTVRIAIAQTLSFLAVLAFFIAHRRRLRAAKPASAATP